jgi:hypothetical protein
MTGADRAKYRITRPLLPAKAAKGFPIIQFYVEDLLPLTPAYSW